MTALIATALVLIGGTHHTAAPDKPVPKEVWEKKVAADLAVFRAEAEASLKLLRGSQQDLLRLAQQAEKSDRPGVAKHLREALRVLEEKGLELQGRNVLESLARSKGGVTDLRTAGERSEQFRLGLRMLVEGLIADPRTEALRENVLKLERGGDANELAKARKELAVVLAPSIRARAQHALAAQLDVSDATGAMVSVAARTPDDVKRPPFVQRAASLGDRQQELARTVESLAKVLETIGEAAQSESLKRARTAGLDAAKLLTGGSVGDSCLKAQADVAAELARVTVRFKSASERPILGHPDLSPEQREAVKSLIDGFESLERRAEKQTSDLRRLRADAEKRLLDELLNDPDEPKK